MSNQTANTIKSVGVIVTLILACLAFVGISRIEDISKLWPIRPTQNLAYHYDDAAGIISLDYPIDTPGIERFVSEDRIIYVMGNSFLYPDMPEDWLSRFFAGGEFISDKWRSLVIEIKQTSIDSEYEWNSYVIATEEMVRNRLKELSANTSNTEPKILEVVHGSPGTMSATIFAEVSPDPGLEVFMDKVVFIFHMEVKEGAILELMASYSDNNHTQWKSDIQRTIDSIRWDPVEASNMLEGLGSGERR